MTIGLILLGVLSILIFFGVLDSSLKRLGLVSWLAFLIVLALVMGAVVPDIRLGGTEIGVSGFLVPLAVGALLVVGIGLDRKVLGLWLATAVVCASAIVIRSMMPSSGFGFTLSTSLLVGVIGGLVAALVGRSTINALGGSIIGILLADAVIAVGGYMFFGLEVVHLGQFGVFDSLVIAAISSVLLATIFEGMQSAVRHHRQSLALNTEAAQDQDLERLAEEIEERKYIE